jgi:serine/threonine protein kinase
MNNRFLVLELCEATIDDYIRRRYMADNMPSDCDALHQMASGVQYIHSKGFVHRNVKPENVLISTSGVLKIADFGFCKPFRPSGSFSMTSSGPRGTRIYCAPEFLQLEGKSKEERDTIRCDVSIDVFSLGCMFFCYIKKGDHPFAKPGSPITYAIASNIVYGKKYLHLGEQSIHYNLNANNLRIIDLF